MALTDAIISSIETELEVLKEAAAPVPEPVVVEPQVRQAPAANISPIIQLAIDQAAERLARETAK
jgi:chromosome condensin MukBEF complex kleisin-like MukF subunit